LGYHLKVRWAPQENLELCGQVKDDIIYVYAENLQNAIETLRHEFIDYVISQAIEPYKKMVNTMIRLQNKDAYEKKEENCRRREKAPRIASLFITFLSVSSWMVER